MGSLYTEVFTVPSAQPLTTITRTIVVGAPTSAALSFSNGGSDNNGAILNDVSLIQQ